MSLTDLLDKVVDVIEIETSIDAEGGKVNKVIVTDASVRCRISPARGKVAHSYGMQTMTCTHVLHFDGHLPITPLTRFVYRSWYQNWSRPEGLRDRWFKPDGHIDADEQNEFTRCEAIEFDPDDLVTPIPPHVPTDYFADTGGGMWHGGEAIADVHRAGLAHGGVRLGGAASASVLVQHVGAAHGGVRLGGASVIGGTSIYVDAAHGGVRLGGAVIPLYHPSGVANYTDVGTGGMRLGGTARVATSKNYVDAAHGGLRLGGTAKVTTSKTYVDAAHGGLRLGGAADVSYHPVGIASTTLSGLI